eukprot:Rmarinus@m.24083
MTIPMRRLMFCLFFVLIAIFPSGQAESTLANELVRVLKTIESKEYEKALIELEVLEPLLHDGSNSAMHSADYHFFSGSHLPQTRSLRRSVETFRCYIRSLAV